MTADRDASEQRQQQQLQQQPPREPESPEQQRQTVRDAERYMAGALSENTLVARIQERLADILDA